MGPAYRRSAEIRLPRRGFPAAQPTQSDSPSKQAERTVMALPASVDP